ncbi:DUF397 domain-containing protein [Streptomyces capoamus]|uniref:DUF397 domain-containing protein n=1 Tax=Streptomyces capoamus TaxID=68183 RepID=UPI0033938023
MQSNLDLALAQWRKSSYSGPDGGDCVECAALGTVAWRKSSYSGTNGGDCVECAIIGHANWRKSSHSGNTGGDCVEVAEGNALVAVRDSKQPDSAHLAVDPRAWAAFVRAL